MFDAVKFKGFHDFLVGNTLHRNFFQNILLYVIVLDIRLMIQITFNIITYFFKNSLNEE